MIRIELFEAGESKSKSMWVVHHTHNRKQEIISKEDYKKAARNLCCEYDEFIEVIKAI